MINLRFVIQKYPECMRSKEKLSALLYKLVLLDNLLDLHIALYNRRLIDNRF